MAPKQPERHHACSHCQGAAPTRRGFLAALSSLLLTLLWPLGARANKIALPLDLAPKLKQVGGWTVLKVKGRKILFIRDTATSVRAIHPICTHKQTQLTYSAKAGLVVCPEHGSRFTLTGKVLKGPAEKALSPVYWTQLDTQKNRIIVRL